jgi:hypothetical protein
MVRRDRDVAAAPRALRRYPFYKTLHAFANQILISFQDKLISHRKRAGGCCDVTAHAGRYVDIVEDYSASDTGERALS